MSQIAITGVRGFGYHGVYPDERREGQEFVVDLILEVDTDAAERSDDVADTVHYGLVAEAVHAEITGAPLNLIEALAARIADRVLAFERVDGVTVTVHKPQAPILVPFSDVSVSVRR